MTQATNLRKILLRIPGVTAAEAQLAIASIIQMRDINFREAIKKMVIKSDIKDMATKSDIREIKSDIKDMATKSDVREATKDMATN